MALLLGTEGHGLSSRWLEAADLRALIPMAGGIDSLNIAAATAVDLLRRTQPTTPVASSP